MSLFTKLANAIFSPVDAAGKERSPANVDAQVWGTEVERSLSDLEEKITASALGITSYATVAAMNADTSKPAGTLAYVYDDGLASGFYQRNASGTAWEVAEGVIDQLTGAVGVVVDNAMEVVGLGGSAIGGGVGFGNVGIGTRALVNSGSGADGNTAVGADAGNPVTTGGLNTFVGFRAGLTQDGTLSATTVIGANTRATENGQIALGPDNSDSIRMFGDRYFLERGLGYRSFYIGRNAGNRNHSGGANLGIGEITLQSITTADGNVAIGDFAMSSHITGSSNVAVGPNALRQSTGVIDCTAVGRWAMEDCIDGVGGTAVGLRAMQRGTSARNNTGIGDSALWQYQGSGSTALGYVVAEYWRTGDLNVTVGIGAAQRRGNGEHNVIVGAYANSFPNQVIDTVTGDGGAIAGNRNVMVGYGAMLNNTGHDNVAVGNLAGTNVTTGGRNTFVGSGAGAASGQKADATNTIAIGRDVVTTADNQIVVGTSSHDEVVLAGVSFTRAELIALKALVAG